MFCHFCITFGANKILFSKYNSIILIFKKGYFLKHLIIYLKSKEKSLCLITNQMQTAESIINSETTAHLQKIRKPKICPLLAAHVWNSLSTQRKRAVCWVDTCMSHGPPGRTEALIPQLLWVWVADGTMEFLSTNCPWPKRIASSMSSPASLKVAFLSERQLTSND